MNILPALHHQLTQDTPYHYTLSPNSIIVKRNYTLHTTTLTITQNDDNIHIAINTTTTFWTKNISLLDPNYYQQILKTIQNP